MSTEHLFLFFTLIAVVTATIVARKLTVPAAITAGSIAILIWLGAGYAGIALLGCFFVLGNLATSWKLVYKQQQGLAEINKGRRTTAQVLANSGAAAIVSMVAIIYPACQFTCLVMIAGSFAAATADTLSSELGNVYGKKFYNIITFKADKRGLDGVISKEGTLIGICGSVVIALVYSMFQKFSPAFAIIVIAGIMGNFFDSILGATMEREHLIGNNLVNFLNTAVGAFIAFLLLKLL